MPDQPAARPEYTLISNWQAVGGNLPAVVEMPWIDGYRPDGQPDPDPGGRRYALGLGRRAARYHPCQNAWKSSNRSLLVEVASRIRIPLAQAMNALVELNMLTSQNERVSEVVSRLTQIWKRIQEWGDDLNALIRIDSEINLQSTNINLSTVLDEVHQNQQRLSPGNHRDPVDLKVEPGTAAGDRRPRTYPAAAQRSNQPGRIAQRERWADPSDCMHVITNDQVWVSISDDGPAVQRNRFTADF